MSVGLRELLRERSQYGGKFAELWLVRHGVDVMATVMALGAGEAWHCHHNCRDLVAQHPDEFVWWTGFHGGYPNPGSFGAHSWVARAGEHLEITFPVPAAAYLGVPLPAAYVWGGDVAPIVEIAALSAAQERDATLRRPWAIS